MEKEKYTYIVEDVETLVEKKRQKKQKRLAMILGIIAAIIVIIIVIVLAVVLSKKEKISKCSTNAYFNNFVVAADDKLCCKIGCEILEDGGNTIDAAIATAFCTGSANMHSTGIGGGGFVTIYNATTKSAIFVDFRETAPYSVDQDLYNNKVVNKAYGPASVAVPGFVKGLHYLWKNYGYLKWSNLVTPTIKMLDSGFKVNSALARAIQQAITAESVSQTQYTALWKQLINPETNTYYKENDTYVDHVLADTLKIIANNPEDFYKGDLAKRIVKDLCDNLPPNNCFLRIEDLEQYQPINRHPLTGKVLGYKIYTGPPPSSGAIIKFVLKVMEESNFNGVNINDINEYSIFLHRMIESFKWGYAQRQYLGDPYLIPIYKFYQEALKFLLQDQTAKDVADNKINNSHTFPQEYYDIFNQNPKKPPADAGTSHLSIMDSEGNAVSMTTTINSGFGSYIRSPSTGIIYNNEMDDFSAAGDTNIYGYGENPNNFILPGRRPMSSMSPTILVDDYTGKAVLVSGASGGSRIPTSIMQNILKYFIVKMSLKDSVYDARVHHQYSPNNVVSEQNWPTNQSILDSLAAKGHSMSVSSGFSVVQSVATEYGKLVGVADHRKSGVPYGI